MDIEQKLDLIQQIHREQAENERYVYDNLKRKTYRQESDSPKDRECGISRWSSFRFRLLVAVLLFLCFFVLDKKELVYGEVNSSKIMEQIENNMEMEDFVVYLKNFFENSIK